MHVPEEVSKFTSFSMDDAFVTRRDPRIVRVMELLRGRTEESLSGNALETDRVEILRILEEFGVTETRDVYDICLERVLGSYPDSEKEKAAETLGILLENGADGAQILDSCEACEAMTRLMEIETLSRSAVWLLIQCLNRFDGFVTHILRSPFITQLLGNTAAGVSVLYPILLREILDLTAGNVDFDYQPICDCCTARFIESSDDLEREIVLECVFIMVKRHVANPVSHWIPSILSKTHQMTSKESDMFFGILIKTNYPCTTDVLTRAIEIAEREDTDDLKYIARIFHSVEYDQWIELEQTGAILRMVRSMERKNAQGKRYTGIIILSYIHDTWTESIEISEILIDCFSALIECLPVMPNSEFLEAMKQIEVMLESPQSEFLMIATNLDLGGIIRDHLSNSGSKAIPRCERILQTYFD